MLFRENRIQTSHILSLEQTISKLNLQKILLLNIIDFLLSEAEQGCPACIPVSSEDEHYDTCWVGITLQEVRGGTR